MGEQLGRLTGAAEADFLVHDEFGGGGRVVDLDHIDVFRADARPLVRSLGGPFGHRLTDALAVTSAQQHGGGNLDFGADAAGHLRGTEDHGG
jgi:hypothetical protein